MRKSFLIALFLLFSSAIFAQERDSLKKDFRIIPDSAAVHKSDTIIIKPGTITRDSVFIPLDTTITTVPSQQRRTDTVRAPKILRQYTLSQNFAEEVTTPVDTGFSMFQRFRRIDKYSPVNAMLGNYGLPFYQISFFDRVADPDKFLYANYYPLMYVPERAVFMDVQSPFTELDWTFGGQRQTSEQTFRVKHSQNINRFLNFGVIYDIIYSLGQYNYQRADDKNFTIFTSYRGNRYKLYLSGGLNNLTSYENGGIKDIA
ncbi:MAG: putative porin, partial [Chloroflexota bacterium]